jgi:hypothetical protein
MLVFIFNHWAETQHARGCRQPWIFLSVVAAGKDENPPEAPSTQDEFDQGSSRSYNSITESYRRDICINLNLDIFVVLAGNLRTQSLPFFAWFQMLAGAAASVAFGLGTARAIKGRGVRCHAGIFVEC